MQRSTAWIATLTVVFAAAAACASTAPTRQRVESTSAVRAAEVMGAEHDPRAAVYLRLARTGIAKAEQLIAADEHGRARSVLERAEVDAQLALALAYQAQSRADAQRAHRAVHALRVRTGQPGGTQ